MPDFCSTYYDTCGPFDLPMKDRQARQLEAMLPTLPEGGTPRFLTLEKAPAVLLPGERADISWISTEDCDRERDVVLASGMNDDHFKLNPIVTLQHCYHLPPVGKSLWRKRTRDGTIIGIKAKTQYPQRPTSWPTGEDWPPDVAFTLVQAGLLRGKSIGFLPLKVRYPTDEERARNPKLQQVRRIIEQWLLLEYACVYLPCQQNAVVEAVSKGLKLSPLFREVLQLPDTHQPIPFLVWSEIEKSIQRRLDQFDFEGTARKSLEQTVARLRGRIT